MNPSIKALLTGAGLAVAVSAHAATITTFAATYGNLYAGADTVSGFNAYDFAPGPVLLEGAQSASTGSNLTGIFEAYTGAHLAPNGSTVAAPNLNTTGSGPGYELTIAGNFSEHIDGISGGVTSFTLTGGNAAMYIGAPDYNFSTDSGFTDGSQLFSGNIVGGNGTFSDTGLGVTKLDFQATHYAGNVYSPGILGGTSVFTLQAPGAGSTSFLSGITSVDGHAVSSNDLLLAGDGNVTLTTVPLPPALWLLGSGIVGLVGFAGKRRV
ncbi:MAG: flocculation-associated PEP-CTERM protein PepA [Betaproteobacteria bacterium]|nr:flocculation-associated PEP-CTERM protein PepA [Betaproteobacteria bacterium]